MAHIHFSLEGGLSPSQIDDVHQAVLRILADTGMACEHRPTIDTVTAEPGVTFQDGRIRFAPETVEGAIERVRQIGRRRTPEDRVRVTTAWTCFNVIDMATDQIRPSTAADCVDMLKLAASCNESGPPPVYPCDLDERIQVLWLEKACLETKKGLGGAMITHQPEALRWIGRLHEAAGKRYTAAIQFVISPLRLDHLALELFSQFRDDPLVNLQASICPIPTGGLTAPLNPEGLLAQGLAESIGGWIVADRLGLADPDTVLPVRTDFGDMRDMTMAYSAPENVMLQVLLRDLSEHFAGYRLDFLYLNTNAKRPDAFCAMDRMAYMLMLGLAGFRHFFMGAGQLSMDEVFSPAQFVIDMEMGRYVQRVLDGLSWKADANTIATAVAEGIAEGSFLAHSTTLDALGEFFNSRLFRRDNLGQWRAAGCPTIEQKAVAQARQMIDSSEEALEPKVQRKLDELFDEACRELGV
ncbi:MAG: trimethylamine methyltransferase family protein, partial [Armatimonadetes bacterium]|nr:trimethylamine methyltransferase family protein [Armatimonadota bacterium]